MAKVLIRRMAFRRGPLWTEKDQLILLNYLKKNDFKAAELKGLFPKRSMAAIRSKVRKIRIKNDLFGYSYRDDKLKFTKEIGAIAKPKIVFDAYAGAGHQTFVWIKTANIVYASENMKNKLSQFKKEAKLHGFKQLKKQDGEWSVFVKKDKRIYYYIGDAIDAATFLKVSKVKIDLIDLDTCGSTIPTIPLFLALLKPKHIIITHGEFHSLRFKRDDVLRRLLVHLNIDKTLLPLTVEKMSVHLDKAVKLSALRAHNETAESFWMNLIHERWLGGKFHGMLRRHYKVSKPAATSDCINLISK